MFSRRASCHLGGFAAATLAWILCSVSMNLPQWRVWYFEEPMESEPSMVLVGMWRTCVYYEERNSDILGVCYQYTYQDTFIPLDIRVAQHLLLISSIIGMVSTISVVVALWKLYTGRFRKKFTYNPFLFPGVLNIIAGVLVFLSVLHNYLAIIRNDGIVFPPSFHIPSIPDIQKFGTALAMATFSFVLFLMGGIISLSFTLSLHSQIHSNI
ncbi:claudin-34-like [Cricetulus griseus]|uniref:Claudin 34D n=1 Tax=Cricetulus griseus TaxID=10029 RepID=A0A8C2M1P0_CRIGR|nr:claudin-34-like [Cricetulus griseus]XP_035305672.1 claudin-34-like [Cricetulus griseus]